MNKKTPKVDSFRGFRRRRKSGILPAQVQYSTLKVFLAKKSDLVRFSEARYYTDGHQNALN